MYIQCKVYVHLCRKWKAYNRTIVVQDAPEGVHKPSDRQLNKSSAASSHLDSASSRRSSSAPSSAVASAQLSQQTQPLTQQSTLTTSNKTSDRDPSALTTAEKLTEKTNAETQTALRGVAILEGECGHAHTTSFGHAHFSGSSPRVHEEAVFFTECECNLQSSKSTVAHNQNNGSTGAKVGVATIAAPVVLPAVHVGTSGHGNNKHHSMSTPNVATLVPRPSSSRRDRQTTPAMRGRPARKLSLSPVRRTELPGSPDVDFINETPLVGQGVPQLNQIGDEARRHTTVLSPIKKPYKIKA